MSHFVYLFSFLYLAGSIDTSLTCWCWGFNDLLCIGNKSLRWIGLRWGDLVSLCKIFHSFTFKYSCVTLAASLSICTVKLHPTLLHLAESELAVYPVAPQHSPFCLVSSFQRMLFQNWLFEMFSFFFFIAKYNLGFLLQIVGGLRWTLCICSCEVFCLW